MTFDANIPLASDSPADFPAQSQTNYSRLKTLIGNDHQFNDASAANDGYHNIINMTQQAPGAGVAAIGQLYAKTAGTYVQLFYMDDNGRDYQVTPGIIASVNFNGTGAVGNQTLRSSLNVTSVNKTATGLYTVTLTTAIADSNYVVSVTGMKESSGEVMGFVQGSATYTDSVTTTVLKIGFENRSGSAKDVTMGNVLIYSVA